MEIIDSSIGELLCEGKTKQIFALKEHKDLVLIVSKDRITAGDGVKSHEMVGKSLLSTQTNCALFEFLSKSGVPTHFVSRVSNNSKAFIAKKCSMIPIEWVCRRRATGSFLKRNANVEEGHRFCPPLLEHFFKDDANHDPFWSQQSIIGAKFKFGEKLIEEKEVKQMLEITRLVFELLERVWSEENHALIDMKIEFGVNLETHEILVSDVIDNDSWRLWESGERAKQLDKQIYRDLKEVSKQDLSRVKQSFEIVAQRTQRLFSDVIQKRSKVAIVLGSDKDMSHALQIKQSLEDKNCDVIIEVTSAHKSTNHTLDIVARLEQEVKVIIAVAGLSNGLGPVIAGNCSLPVINCPPVNSSQSAALQMDIWSSLRMPSSIGCSTVVGVENAALAAALIVANENAMVWSRVRTQQLMNKLKLILF